MYDCIQRKTTADCRGVKMNRESLEIYIEETYGACAEYLWQRYPNYAVYRHRGNRKWFAVMMDLPRSRLGLDGEGTVHVVNLKCDPVLTGMMLKEKGIFPGYHMNKAHWITVSLDAVDSDKIKSLLQMSFLLTDKKT